MPPSLHGQRPLPHRVSICVALQLACGTTSSPDVSGASGAAGTTEVADDGASSTASGQTAGGGDDGQPGDGDPPEVVTGGEQVGLVVHEVAGPTGAISAEVAIAAGNDGRVFAIASWAVGPHSAELWFAEGGSGGFDSEVLLDWRTDEDDYSHFALAVDGRGEPVIAYGGRTGTNRELASLNVLTRDPDWAARELVVLQKCPTSTASGTKLSNLYAQNDGNGAVTVVYQEFGDQFTYSDCGALGYFTQQGALWPHTVISSEVAYFILSLATPQTGPTQLVSSTHIEEGVKVFTIDGPNWVEHQLGGGPHTDFRYSGTPAVATTDGLLLYLDAQSPSAPPYVMQWSGAGAIPSFTELPEDFPKPTLSRTPAGDARAMYFSRPSLLGLADFSASGVADLVLIDVRDDPRTEGWYPYPQSSLSQIVPHDAFAPVTDRDYIAGFRDGAFEILEVPR